MVKFVCKKQKTNPFVSLVVLQENLDVVKDKTWERLLSHFVVLFAIGFDLQLTEKCHKTK